MTWKSKKKWSDFTPIEKQKRIAWSVATSTAIETRRDPVDIYNKLLEEFKEVDNCGHMVLDESNESN